MSNVAVLSPKSLFRSCLATLLNTLGFEHVDQAATLIELKERTPSGSKPEILLVDLTSEIETVSCFMDDIKAWLPETKVVLLAETLDIGRLGECFAAGASGYLLEDLSGEALEKSLTLVSAGEKVFPSEL